MSDTREMRRKWRSIQIKMNRKVTMLNMDVEMEPNVILIVASMFFLSHSISFKTRTNMHISWTSLEDSSSCTCMSIAHMKKSCQEVATWLTGTVLDFGSSFCSELLWHEQKHPSLWMWNRERNCYSGKLSIKFCQVFFFSSWGQLEVEALVGQQRVTGSGCKWSTFLPVSAKAALGAPGKRSMMRQYKLILRLKFLWFRNNKKESYVKLLSKFFRSGNISSTSSLPMGIINLVRTSLKVLTA